MNIEATKEQPKVLPFIPKKKVRVTDMYSEQFLKWLQGKKGKTRA